MKHFRSMNPHDNSVIGEVALSTDDEVGQKVAAARHALPAWRALGVTGRVSKLRRFAEIFYLRTEEFAQLVSREMGMPIVASRADVHDALTYLSWYLDNAEKYLVSEVTYEDAHEIHTLYHEPFGVVAVIVPWNVPASNFVWGCGQHLIAGNTVVFKHSEEVPLCGQMIEKMMLEAGMPPDVFAEVYGKGPVGALLARQNVDLVCFTGSTEVGASLYRIASQAMKPIRMELGGSAAGIVFEDADLDAMIGHIYEARFANAGQMCDALKRLLIHESIWDPVVERLTAKLGMIRLGDPSKPENQMGPLVAKRQVDLLERQVADAVGKGAFVVVGGKRPALTGAYYEPTLLSNITTDMRVWREEVFGPVLPMMRFASEEEAIMLANDTEYGLGGYIYTKDARRATRVAQGLQTGSVSINGISYVRPANPFGGYKHSGLGRQHGRRGFEEVTQAKVVAQKK